MECVSPCTKTKHGPVVEPENPLIEKGFLRIHRLLVDLCGRLRTHASKRTGAAMTLTRVAGFVWNNPSCAKGVLTCVTRPAHHTSLRYLLHPWGRGGAVDGAEGACAGAQGVQGLQPVAGPLTG